jgi:DNA polymerase III delta subunit
MIYLYWGTDEKKTSEAAQKAVESLRARAPEAAIERLTDEAEMLDIEGLLASRGLFFAKRAVLFDTVCAKAALKAELMAHLPAMAASEHVFFIREGKLLAPDLKKLEWHAAKAIEYSKPKTEAKRSFALSDALLARDSKALWIAIVLALRDGSSPEEVHGSIFASAKGIAIAARAANAEESGMHAFVFQKSKAALKRYSPREAKALVAALAALPHEVRRRSDDLELALERFALEL